MGATGLTGEDGCYGGTRTVVKEEEGEEAEAESEEGAVSSEAGLRCGLIATELYSLL